ncbi:MAG: serine/threonine-protein kinase [Planctomycetes bacterium]|nr:serine/threonine-protein kinase [Planctomycetota bacterium]
MTLSAGTEFGPYKIIAPLGAGGMGEVYRARDAKLDREVAIKVLPDTFARDPERIARFQREAKVLASLNHPSIAAIYGFEESDGKRFLVLELVEGETLAERLRGGVLPVDEGLEVCKQIAEALEAAHEKGVIHRDLKPGNVMIRPDGSVKVLDFGLAKAFSPIDEVSPTQIAESPTITAAFTRPGVVLGTAAYMSPEQARGKPLDKRTDIWSFGVVLYECLGGRRPFEGETATDLIAKILERDPDWTGLPGDTPLTVQLLLKRCLQKDRKRRLHDIGDARIEIEEALSEPWVEKATLAGVSRPTRWGLAVPWSITALMVIIVTSFIVRGWMGSTPSVPRLVWRFAIDLPAEAPVVVADTPSVAVSPDGTRLVYVGWRDGGTQLYLRVIDEFAVTPIPGTEDGTGPFFSPDGKWVGYFDYRAGKLKKVPLRGGGTIDICDAPPSSRGASWGMDDVIVFTRGITGGLYTVSATGGTPQPLATPDFEKGEKSCRLPQILPGGKGVLFTMSTSDIDSYDDATIAVVLLETGERKILFKGGSNARYAPTGHIVYARAGSLMAVPFDLERLEVTGSPFQILKGVVTSDMYGSAQFSFSGDGTLIYVPGGPEIYYNRLVLVDRKGEVDPLPVAPGIYKAVRFSPDGQRLAIHLQGGNEDVWIYELGRGTMSRLTTAGWDNQSPVWTPDGSRVAFQSNSRGSFDLFWIPADRSGPAELLLESEYGLRPLCWSSDGKLLVYTQSQPAGRDDIWVLPVDGEGTPRRLVETQFREAGAALSPDDRWLAYTSNETGQDEVYVQAFPDPGRKWLISTRGGSHPVWGPDAEALELFYRKGNKMMVVGIQTEPTFSPGAPKPLFELEDASFLPPFDISPDGRHFVMIQKGEQSAPPTQLRVVLNWFEELKAKVPTGTSR